MMINKDEFYLKDIELLKKLAPVMERLGIVEDDWWCFSEPENDECGNPLVLNPQWYLQSECGECWEEEGNNGLVPVADDYYKTWRSDSLEAALPEWVLSGYNIGQYSLNSNDIKQEKVFQAIRKADKLYASLVKLRGQPKLEALANLILVLDSEGLLLEGENK